MIGHNIRKFDAPRLEYLINRFLGQSILFYEIEDTLELCREQLNLKCNKLEDICQHFRIIHENRHRALGDCRATLEVYKRLTQPQLV